MNILLAICTNRGVKAKTAKSLLDLVTSSKHSFKIFIAERGYTIAENRNAAVLDAQKNKSDYLLFIDDDMVFPSDTLDVLVSHGKEIVGVDSNTRSTPTHSTVFYFDENKEKTTKDRIAFLPEALFECWAVGTGIMLIDMNVFEKIPKPWFAFETFEDGKIKIGEDVFFCKLARSVGFNVYCDPTIKVGHIGDFIY